MSLSLPAFNEGFPLLAGADTLVVVSNHYIYKLHSTTLKQCSTLFTMLLEKDDDALMTAEARANIKNGLGFRYQLVLQNRDPRTGEEILPIFHRVRLNGQGCPDRRVDLIYEEREHNVKPQLYKYYDMLLGCFFGIDLNINIKNVGALADHAIGLLRVAEYLGSAHLVRKTLDNSLISMGQKLYRAIAQTPMFFMDLGSRLESRVIYKDALIHLAGRYNEFKAQKPSPDFVRKNPIARSLLDEIEPLLRDKLESMVMELREMCKQVERSMVTWYPPQLNRESVSGRADRDDIGRASYGTDVFNWMALGLFRHYIGQQLAADESRYALDGGYKFYSNIYEGNTAYLSLEDIESFHRMFPMSKKGQSCFKSYVNIYKKLGHNLVEDLMRNETQLNVTETPVTWLVCARVGEKDFPWVKPTSSKLPEFGSMAESDQATIPNTDSFPGPHNSIFQAEAGPSGKSTTGKSPPGKNSLGKRAREDTSSSDEDAYEVARIHAIRRRLQAESKEKPKS